MTLPAGVILRNPGIQHTEAWDTETARGLVLEAVRLEGRWNRQIPRVSEVALNAAVTRRDMVAVRAWVKRIERELSRAAEFEIAPVSGEQARLFGGAP